MPDTEHKGLAPRANPYTYRFIQNWTESRKAAVKKAFDLWNDANARSGLATRFAPAEGAEGQDIAVWRQPLGVNSDLEPILGWFPTPDPPRLQPDGRINGGSLFLTTDESALSSDMGYRKMALHEIGHALGLAHTGRRDGSSVMNRAGRIRSGNVFEKRDDYLRWMPEDVTICDQEAAKKRAETQ